MDEIRSWWEVPSIAHFCSLFRTAFDLTDFDIEDLEDALLETENEEGSAFLLDLICRLLNGCYARKDITVANYDLYVKDIVKYKWGTTDNPVKDKSEFQELTLREKVEFIYAVCEYRLDTEDVSDVIKGFDGDSMRVEPLGKDKDGALYWYFYGSRLYMEDPEPRKTLTKEEKRTLEREKRIAAKKKKEEEKRQKKEEKKKLKALKKNDKKKQLEQAANKEKAEDTNTRRSGRLRNKKVVVEESESSESSSSSSEEEELVDSSSEEEEEEEIVEKTPAKSRSRAKKTPAKSTGKKTNKKTPAKKDTPPKPTRSSSRKSKTTKKMEESRASQPERSTRRSLNTRSKPTPTPSAYDSETEEEIDYDVDSGHESAGSVRSEMSKTSQRINVAGRRTSRRPTANVDLKRDPSNVNDEDDDNDDDEGSKGANFTVDDTGNDGVKDGVKSVNNDVTTDEQNDQSMEAEIKDKPASSDEKGVDEQEAVENCNNSNNVNQTKDLNQRTLLETAQKPERNNEASAEKVENTEGESKENGNNDTEKKEDLDKADTDQKMAEAVNADIEEREVTPDSEGDTGESSGKDIVKTEANIDADTICGDGKVKTESNVDNIKDSNEDSDQTIPESEPMDVDDEYSQGTTRELRKRIKVEPIEIKKDNADSSIKTDDMIKLTLDKPAVAPVPSKSVTRWHLVCATLDDWVNLAEWFKESTVRCEKSLSKEISENFLPVLPEIIQAREKEITRKLMQEQDLRRSNRLTLKQREKLEQEKILAEALAEEEKARIQADEDRRLKEEQLRLEDENRQREERRKAREERAARLSMREERARLIAEGKEIPPELIYTGTAATQKYKDDEDSDDSRCDLKDEEDYAALRKVISAMKYHKDCWPFLEPVTDEVAPGYSDIIKRPMDLSKIEEKVEKRDYRSRQHFLSDFRLMFNNCKRYNGQDSDFSDCARSMEIMLKKYIKRFVTEESTDKYYNDEDFMVAGGKGRLSVGEKRYRPKRAASSKAIATVHRALNSSEEESSSSDEEDKVQYKRRRESNMNQSPFKVQSHHDLLLEELKRQREKKLAASALQNHKIITRGPERIRVPNPSGGGVMIIPKSEMNSSGVLRMAATREIKRKVNPQFQRGQVVHTINPARKDFGMNIIDQTTPGSSQPKTIRIVASSGTGQGSVKQTAENVKVSADGFLIISGKNSGIKVTENTKIVIQPPGAQQQSGSGSQSPAAQSPVTVGGSTPDFSQLAGASKTPSTPGSSSETPGNASPASGPLVLSNLLRQVAGSQILSAHDQSRLQALVRQYASDANLTPEKMKTIDIARKILQLNLHKRKMLQQKAESEANTPKIARLESQSSESSGSSIEQRLRDPSVNIDNQLGSVSKNVISNVNIASDILDTYYSVMNEAKIKPNVGSSPVITVTRPSATVTQATVVTIPGGTALSSPKCQSTVSSTTGPVTTSGTVTSSASKPTASHGSISDMTRLIINLMNKGDSGGVNVSVQRPPSAVNTAVTQSATDTQIARTQESSATPVVASVGGPTPVVGIPTVVVDGGPTPVVTGPTPSVGVPTPAVGGSSVSNNNILTNTFPAMNASSLSGITSSSSVSDLLRSASAQHTSPPTNNDVSPIEALFMSNTSVKSNPVSVSKASIVEALTCSVPGSGVDQMSDQSLNNPSVLTSPEKNERPNLFDSFENRSPGSKQSVSTNEFSSISNTDEKTIRMKLRADKMPLPSSSTVNFGSPLKTTSVLEALKCKLHTLKPDVQGYEGSDVTCSCMELTLYSELAGDGSADTCIYDAHIAACSQSPVCCVTSQPVLPYNSTLSSSHCIHSSCACCCATVNDSCNNEQPSRCATVNDSCNYELPSPHTCRRATVNDSCNYEQPSLHTCCHVSVNESCLERPEYFDECKCSNQSTEKSGALATLREIRMENDFDKKVQFQSEFPVVEGATDITGAIDLSIKGINGKHAMNSTDDNAGTIDTFHDVGAISTGRNVNETNENESNIGSTKQGSDGVIDSNNNNSEVTATGECLTPVVKLSTSSALKWDGTYAEEEEELPDCECFDMEPCTSSLGTEVECVCSQDNTETENDTVIDNNNIPADERKDTSSVRYACKLSTKRLTDSVLKVSVDVKEFHFQKKEQIQIAEEEKSQLLSSTKLKDYIIQRPNLKQKKSSPVPDNHIFLNSPQVHLQTNSYSYCTSPQIPGQVIAHSYLGSPPNPGQTICPIFCNSPQIPGQPSSGLYSKSPQMERQTNNDILPVTSPGLLEETCSATSLNSTQKTTHSDHKQQKRSVRKNSRFQQLCDTVKMYKICSIKPKSCPDLGATELQQNEMSSSNTNQVCGQNGRARKKLSMSIPSTRPLRNTNKSVWTTKEQLLEEYQEKNIAETAPIPGQQYLEHGILGDTENDAFYSSVSSNSEPFISPAFHTHTDSSYIDSSLVPSVDFHSFSPNTFISNNFIGDGNDIDDEFAKIENDIFELQEKYPAPLPSASTNVPQPACDLGLKPSSESPFIDKRMTSLVSTAGYLNTSSIGGSSVVMPSSAVTPIHQQVLSPSVQTLSENIPNIPLHHTSSSNISSTSLDYGVYDSAILNSANLPGNQATGLAIPTIKVIPQPTSFTVDFSKLDGINRGMNAPVQNVQSSAANLNNSTIIRAPASVTNHTDMTGSMLTQIEPMEISLTTTQVTPDNQSTM